MIIVRKRQTSVGHCLLLAVLFLRHRWMESLPSFIDSGDHIVSQNAYDRVAHLYVIIWRDSSKNNISRVCLFIDRISSVIAFTLENQSNPDSFACMH